MKTRLTGVLAVVLFFEFIAVVFSEVNKKPQKFEVVFSIKYNEMTFEQAAKKEKEIREMFSDACEVSIKVNAVNQVVYGWTVPGIPDTHPIHHESLRDSLIYKGFGGTATIDSSGNFIIN